jgi:hypothetical protein
MIGPGPLTMFNLTTFIIIKNDLYMKIHQLKFKILYGYDTHKKWYYFIHALLFMKRVFEAQYFFFIF